MPLDQHLLMLFAVTTIIAMIVPGPDMLFVLGCGMSGRPRAGLLATAGVATSEAIHIALAAAGLAALFAAAPFGGADRRCGVSGVPRCAGDPAPQR